MKNFIFLCYLCIGTAFANSDNDNLVWIFETGGRVYSSPLIDGEMVYFGSGDHHFYALNKKSGKQEWMFETGGAVHSSPAVRGNTLYFGSSDGNLYAVDKQSGKLIWKFTSAGEKMYGLWDYYLSSPAIENDKVYWGSGDGHLYALDANTGRGKWNLKQASGWIIATPLEHKGNLYFGTSDAHIFYSMEKDAGTINWTIPLNMRVYGTAKVDDDIVYFGTFDGKVLGIDYLTGDVKWHFQTESSKQNYHTVYDENGAFKEGFVLYGEDWKTPEKMIHALGSVLSSPAIENGVIYFGSSDGNLYAVSLQ